MKCDERPGICLNCERLHLECQKVDGTSATPTKPDDAKASQAPESPLGEVGVKRKRTFRSCAQCRASKARCSGGRPECARCIQRAVSCVYDEDSIPQWTRVVRSARQSDVQTDTSTSESNTKDKDDATGSRQVSADAPGQLSPITMSIEQPIQSATVSEFPQATTGPAAHPRRSTSVRASHTDEGPDSLEWYVLIVSSTSKSKFNPVLGFSNHSFPIASGFGCWSRSTSKIYIPCVAIHSFIDHPSYSGLKNLPMMTIPGMVYFMSSVHLVQSMLMLQKSLWAQLTARQVLCFTIYKHPQSLVFSKNPICW